MDSLIPVEVAGGHQTHRQAVAAQAGLRELEALECRIGGVHRTAGAHLEADKGARSNDVASPAQAKLAEAEALKTTMHDAWRAAKSELRRLERSGCDAEMLVYSKHRLAAAEEELGQARALVRDAHEAVSEERAGRRRGGHQRGRAPCALRARGIPALLEG